MPHEPDTTRALEPASVDPQSVEGLFVAALGKASPAEREAFLNEACGGDDDMRRRVEALLRAYDDAGSFLEQPAAEGVHPAADVPGSPEEVRLDFLTPTDKPDRIGLLGPYEIIELIGRGGMGIVLRGFDPKLNRVVAIKVLAPELAANPNARRRFTREAQAAASISHPHVVTIHAVEDGRNERNPVSETLPYLVMECVSGQSLQEKLDREGALRLTEILRIGKQVAEGLAAAHQQGLIHRDIKPANILLENGVERVKITDFGLARAVDDVAITRTGEVTGTPQYMSPEQAKGERVDHRSDLFSLGCVLYAMCSGRPPFRADSMAGVINRVINDEPRPLTELNPELPDWLAGIVYRLLAKDPDERFQTADELAELLGEHLARTQHPRPGGIPAREGARDRGAAWRPVSSIGRRREDRPAATGRGSLLATPASQFALLVLAWMCGSFAALAFFTPSDDPGGVMGSLIRVSVVYGGAALILLPAIAITAGRRGYPVFNALLQGSAFVLVSWLAMYLWVIGLTRDDMDVVAELLSFGPVVLVVAGWSIYRPGVTRIAGAGHDRDGARVLTICGALTWLLLILLFGTLGPDLRTTPLRDWLDGEVAAIYLYRAWLGAGLLGAGLWLSRKQPDESPWRELLTAVVMTLLGPISLLAGLVRVTSVASSRDVPSQERPRRDRAHSALGKPGTILAWLAVAVVSLVLIAPCLLGISWYIASMAQRPRPPVDRVLTPVSPSASVGSSGAAGATTAALPRGAVILDLQDEGLSVEFRPQNIVTSPPVVVPGSTYRSSGTYELSAGKYTPIVRDQFFGWVQEPEDAAATLESMMMDMEEGFDLVPRMAGSSGHSSWDALPTYVLTTIEIEPGALATLTVRRDFSALAVREPDWTQTKLLRFLWSGDAYVLSKPQAKVVQRLLEAYVSGDVDVPESDLFILAANALDTDERVIQDADAGSELRVYDTDAGLAGYFNDGLHPAWGTLIVPGETDGTYRLAEPVESSTGPPIPDGPGPPAGSLGDGPATGGRR